MIMTGHGKHTIHTVPKEAIMHIVLVGLNYRTAPVAFREQFALADCGVRMALEDFDVARHPHRTPGSDQASLKEAVILSTCNRLEVYAVVLGDPQVGREIIESYLACPRWAEGDSSSYEGCCRP
jgi:glutamyl-tRNA reductase